MKLSMSNNSVQYLFEKQNIVLNIKVFYERTSLHYECENGYLKIVKYLVFQGASKKIIILVIMIFIMHQEVVIFQWYNM